MKRYIWGFPGVGKSNIQSNARVFDADCELFKNKNISADDLHSGKLLQHITRDENYPQNYLEYIQKVDADVVLINCHITLLEQLDREQVLLVYPSKELISEYLQRYEVRGDNASFVSYMELEAPGMIDFIDQSSFDKYKILDSNTYLSDLFKRSDFKMKLMTRAELTEQLQRAIDLDVMIATYQAGDNAQLVCDSKYCGVETKEIQASVNCAVDRIADAAQLADAVLDGKYQLDIDRLMDVCAQRERFIQQENDKAKRRGGLSREDLKDKIMQGIVNGALGIYHGQIAPYSYGYEVFYKDENYQRSWHCYCNFFDIPKTIVDDIENVRQTNSTTLNVQDLLATIEKKEGEKITAFTPAKDTDFVRAKNSYTYPYRSSIASVKDVHAGKGLDGIVQGFYQGDYSSITTNSQNSLVRTLVCMKGFCLDCINLLDIGPEGRQKVVDYLKKHGTDVSTPEKLQGWVLDNPNKCGREENRVKYHFNEAQELYANAYVDFMKLKEMVSNHKGTLEDFCAEHDLDGEWSDDVFGCYFGAVIASVFQNRDGSLGINDNNIGVWDDKHQCLVKDDVTLRYLKDTCVETGFDIKALDAQAKWKGCLDARIADAAAKVVNNSDVRHKKENTLTK